MITNLKPYPTMKDSGVPWLGEVPKHWAVKRLRNISEMRVSNVDKHSKEGEIPVRLCNYVDVYKNDRIREQMSFMLATATAEEIERFRLKSDDVLITKDSETWDDIGVPALVNAPAADVISGYHLALLRSNKHKLSGKYLFRSLQSKPIAYQFHVEAKGVTRFGLSHLGIKSIWLPLPPLSEQTAIVHFLNHYDRKIRRYILAKQKLIKLLEEEKQAIIHRAVTRGLDPNVPLKPSGVPWLGKVPAHWPLTPNRSLFRIRKALVGSRHTRYQLLSLTKKGVIVRDMTTGKGKFSNFLERLQEVRPGDLVFCLFDVDETPRTVGLSRHLGMISGDYTVMECTDTLKGPFLECFYKAMDDHKLLSPLYTGLRKRISKPLLLAAKTPIPPLLEETAIVKHLDTATTDIEATISREVRKMEFLNEYRTRLIADVVTGKLDVRKAAELLPADIEELEILDEAHALTEEEADAADNLDAISEEVEV